MQNRTLQCSQTACFRGSASHLVPGGHQRQLGASVVPAHCFYFCLFDSDPIKCSMLLQPAKAAVGFGQGRLLAAARSAQRRISSFSSTGRGRSPDRSTRWAPPPNGPPRRFGESPLLAVQHLPQVPNPLVHDPSPTLSASDADNLLQHYRRAMELEVDFFRQVSGAAWLLSLLGAVPRPASVLLPAG